MKAISIPWPDLSLPEGRGRRAGESGPFLGVLLGLALALWPVWRWYGLRLNDGSDEPMGLLALAAAGWFLGKERSRLCIEGRSLLAGTMGLFVYAFAFPVLPSLVRAMLALGIIGAVLRFDRLSPGIWGLLILSLPVIATAQFFAGWPLRQFTAWGAEHLLALGGLEVSRTGTVLWWQGQAVGMDAPCSGIRMLWTGLVLHCLLAAHYRVRLGPLVFLTVGAVAAIVLANLLRATALFLKESGALNLPSWTHEGIGLVIFAGVAWGFGRIGERFRREDPEEDSEGSVSFRRPSRFLVGTFVAALAAAGMAPWIHEATAGDRGDASIADTAPFPGWPATWEGRDLVPVPLTEAEQSFAAGFPGRVAVFRTAEGPWSRRLIFRWVTRPTRKLHSSADCLRASGFTLEERPSERAETGGGDRWSRWEAYDSADPGRFQVREQLWAQGDPTENWAEVSVWFWDAALGNSQGPWWALTVIEPQTP